jgi:cell division protein FtsI/penicillin-binding protein 2
VYGKTGEAEFPGGSHSWFAGYRGDLAFASLIVGGGSSEYAVRMTKFMFESMPRDYLA